MDPSQKLPRPWACQFLIRTSLKIFLYEVFMPPPSNNPATLKFFLKIFEKILSKNGGKHVFLDQFSQLEKNVKKNIYRVPT